jgi:MYXO-CTERM domain-containing protein
MSPGQLVPFAEGNGIVFAGSAVLPYVSETGREDLYAAVSAGAGMSLQVTSAYRTVVQQYLLYRWFQLGRCGITAAATPGNSNHESGRALDVSNYNAWITILADHAWDHSVPGDPVHFDHLQSPDIRGTDVLAFQRLWNRNNPGDVIAEDGDYGPATEARLKMAPAEGFATGPMCAPGGLAMAIESIDAPRVMPPGERATVTLVLRNSGSAPWPAGTALVTAEPAGRASDFADASWPAPDRPSVIDGAVAPGELVTLVVEIVAPDVPAAEERTESFAMDANGTRFGMLALVVRVDPDSGAGCCNSSGGGDARSALLLLAAAVAYPRRRRRGTMAT